jgi:hypothetical protein
MDKVIEYTYKSRINYATLEYAVESEVTLEKIGDTDYELTVDSSVSTPEPIESFGGFAAYAMVPVDTKTFNFSAESVDEAHSLAAQFLLGHRVELSKLYEAASGKKGN